MSRGPVMAAALAAGVALGATPVPTADATPLMNGTYTASSPHGSTSWSVNSTCSQAGCVAHVVSVDGWSGEAQYAGRHWVLELIGRPDGVRCADGSTAPANVIWSWDGESLRGEVRVTHGAGCGNPPIPPGSLRDEFWLTKDD